MYTARGRNIAILYDMCYTLVWMNTCDTLCSFCALTPAEWATSYFYIIEEEIANLNFSKDHTKRKYACAPCARIYLGAYYLNLLQNRRYEDNESKCHICKQFVNPHRDHYIGCAEQILFPDRHAIIRSIIYFCKDCFHCIAGKNFWDWINVYSKHL